MLRDIRKPPKNTIDGDFVLENNTNAAVYHCDGTENLFRI